MNISRDRHLDDTADHRVVLALLTPSHSMHSLIGDAPTEVRDELGVILVDALDRIEALLRPLVAAGTPAKRSASFGCGT